MRKNKMDHETAVAYIAVGARSLGWKILLADQRKPSVMIIGTDKSIKEMENGKSKIRFIEFEQAIMQEAPDDHR